MAEKTAGNLKVGENETLTVRRIDNGYITSRSSYNDKSGYKSTETFSADRPQVTVPTAKPAPNANPAKKATPAPTQPKATPVSARRTGRK